MHAETCVYVYRDKIRKILGYSRVMSSVIAYNAMWFSFACILAKETHRKDVAVQSINHYRLNAFFNSKTSSVSPQLKRTSISLITV